ncbi:MAG: hypothetical protein Q8K36_04355 [Alphaproteobacteria bacterium]|nr:hypothetical protein [Alphaproteobacteria bacterium]
MNQWTQNDINLLKTYYMQGLPIKLISQHLGRSQTALSKAISRFNLLKYKPVQTVRNEYRNILDDSLSILRRKANHKAAQIKRFFCLETSEKWVRLDEVIAYLKRNKIRVSLLNQKNGSGECLYSLNQKTVVSSQLLLAANRLRVEKNQVPFKVKNLSW